MNCARTLQSSPAAKNISTQRNISSVTGTLKIRKTCRRYIARVNEIRKKHPALHSNRTLRFHPTDQPFLISYSKTDPEKKDVILVVVNLDHQNTQTGWVELDLAELGIQLNQTFHVHDLLTDQSYHWAGARNYIQLEAGRSHIFHVETESAPSA